MKAALLTVGTEITSGEILNRNSAWLASQLQEQAVEVILHHSTPDDRKLILSSLNYLEPYVDLLFVTGGLGPTSDDFTREVIATFVAQPLEFRDAVWAELTELYSQRGLTLREAHRQQCYFPRHAELLNNPVGSAHGFLCTHGKKKIFVMPGPPHEVHGTYVNSILPLLQMMDLPIERELTVLKCLGAPESEVAEIVERSLQGRGLLLGYRASHPYVLVKVWHPLGDKNWFEVLKEKLAPWFIGDAHFDLADEWLKNLKDFQTVRVIDEATGGCLGARLEPITRNKQDGKVELELVTYWGLSVEYSRDTFREPVDAYFAVHSDGKSEGYRVTANLRGQAISKTLKLPYKISPRSERGRLMITEQTLQLWYQFTRRRRE